MEEATIKKIWEDSCRQLETAKVLNLQAWALNTHSFEMMQLQKAKSRLNALLPLKLFAVILGFIWVAFLCLLVYGNRMSNPYFTISVAIIALFNILAIAVYLRHVAWIRQINFSESIISTQEKLSRLQASTINIVRILMLQFPFYTTWFWHSSWMGTTRFWLISFPITIGFALLGWWLFKNITIKNMNRKWIRRFMMLGPEYKNLLQAKEMMEETEAFRENL